MDKAQVIASLADDLYATEQSVDEAITRATTLVQSMIGARTALNLSAVAAAESQTKALEAIASLGAARRAIVECHDEMAKDHRRLGFGVFAGGFMGKGEQTRPPTAGERRLHAV